MADRSVPAKPAQQSLLPHRKWDALFSPVSRRELIGYGAQSQLHPGQAVRRN